MKRTWIKSTLVATTSAAVIVSGCGSHRKASSQAAAASSSSYAQGGPGFDFVFTGAVQGHGTPENAGKLPGGTPAGAVGGGAGLADCGPQPRTTQRFAGAYVLATRVSLPQYVVLRVVVPNYSNPGTYAAASSASANPPGTAIEVDEQIAVAQGGQITVTDAKSGSVTADFTTAKGPVHLSGTWRCP